MKLNQLPTRAIFKEIGRVRWTPFDAFDVKTKRGAVLRLSPNSDVSPSAVHIDEIRVRENLRRRGIGSEAIRTLCRVADKYQFCLEGGPVGPNYCPWADKFVEWLQGFGFRRDRRSPSPVSDDGLAFNVWRKPKPRMNLHRRTQSREAENGLR